MLYIHMFPPARQALMRGSHTPWHAPPPQSEYPANPHTAFLIDVAGEDEGAMHLDGALHLKSDALSNPQRDSTALTTVEIDLTTISDDLIQAPRYLVISAALCALLDDQQWGTAESSIVIAQDPLSDLGEV